MPAGITNRSDAWNRLSLRISQAAPEVFPLESEFPASDQTIYPLLRQSTSPLAAIFSGLVSIPLFAAFPSHLPTSLPCHLFIFFPSPLLAFSAGHIPLPVVGTETDGLPALTKEKADLCHSVGPSALQLRILHLVASAGKDTDSPLDEVQFCPAT